MKSFFLLISLVVFLFCPAFLFAACEDNPGMSDSWMNAAMRNIEKEEYKPSLQKLDYRGESFTHPKFHLANRANNLRAYFDENGMELISRVISEEEKWSLRIKSIAITSGKDEKFFSDLDVAINGDNIICTGDGIEVVYSNSESGIRQSILIQEGIKTERVDFIIEAENLDITPERDRFVLNNKENAIIYQIEEIEDADGKEVSYSLSNAEDKLKISLGEENLIYPIVISANITLNTPPAEDLFASISAKGRSLPQSFNWSGESDQLDAWFGYSVSTGGDVNGDGYSEVIVGVPLYDGGQADEGCAFAYYGSSSGLPGSPSWSYESDQAGAQFGFSVSWAGNTDDEPEDFCEVVIGAPFYDQVKVDEGAVFLFETSFNDPEGGLLDIPVGIGRSYQDSAHLGWSVTSLDVIRDGYSDLIVGAPDYDSLGKNVGAIFLYRGPNIGEYPSQIICGSQENAKFGFSVSGAGMSTNYRPYIIVGAPYYDSTYEDEGKVLTYWGGESHINSIPSLEMTSGQTGACLGISVSGAGDVNGDDYPDAIVGAPFYSNGQSHEGRAFVFNIGGGATSISWIGEINQADARFGTSVSGAGDVNGDGYSDVIVGAPGYDGNRGGVFVYLGGPDGVTSPGPLPDWTVQSSQTNSYFGYSVCTAGDVNGDGYSDVIVGAPLYDHGQNNEGRAFVYHGSSSGLSDLPDWIEEFGQADAFFGYSVSTAGDVNGDGFSDVIMGAYQYDGGQTNEGASFVYNGGPSGLSASHDWVAESDQDEAWFGYSVAGAGDVNGDGYSDVIVGARNYDGAETDGGGAFVYHGDSLGLSTSYDWAEEFSQEYACFGYSVSTAGDVNGDGYSDVIVGAFAYNNEQVAEGGAFVYHGGSSGLSTSHDWSAESDQMGAFFGASVSSAGDVNGDGYSDVIVGAPWYDDVESNEGGAFVYHGGGGGLSVSPDWNANSGQAQAYFGTSVSKAGDVNGDGYSDVIVGAYAYDNPETDEGGAFVYRGSPSGLSASYNWMAESDQDEAWFGYSVSTAGDVNGDGYSDVIVGARDYTHGQMNEGCAFVYHGSSLELSMSYDWIGESNQPDAEFGYSVSTAGDVNGDGYSDVIVGAPCYDNVGTDEGRAFVYYGNGGGVSLIPTQSAYVWPVGSHPVQLGNLTGTSGVQLNILGKIPGGQGKLKLQWEVKELGQLFDGTSVSESDSWYLCGLHGVEISEDVADLQEGTAYHWRIRLKYAPLSYTALTHSRWLSIGPNGWNEKDFITTALAGIEDDPGVNANLQLSVFPSISAGAFSISFSVSEEDTKEDINLKVYNKAGIMVKSLFRGKKPAGTHTITLNGNKLPNDIYFISLKKGKKEQIVRKVVLLK